MLFTIHTVAAAITKVRALAIPRKGCEELADAVMRVTELYEVPLLNEKGMSWANLAAVAAKVYIFEGASREQSGKVAREQPDSEKVVSMPGFMVNGSGGVH